MNINKIIKDDTYIKKSENSKYSSLKNNKSNRTRQRNKTVKINKNNIINIKEINSKSNSYNNEQQKSEKKIKNINTGIRIKYLEDNKDIETDIDNILKLYKHKKINNSLSSSFNKDKIDVKLKLLSDKEKTVTNNLKNLKEKKNFIQNISLKNIGTPIGLIDNNINKDILKNINIKENELNEKLFSIDSEINNLLSTKNDNTNKNKLKNQLHNYLSFCREEKKIKSNKFISKLRRINNEYKNNINYNKEKDMQIDIIEEKEKEFEKKLFLSEQRHKEINIILKRKEERNKKFKNLMNNIQKPINLKKNYLYLKMENDYIENENKYIKDRNVQRKLEMKKENKKINVTKNDSAEKAKKK